MRYRRTDTPGATYFFTVNLADRRQRLLCEHIDTLRSAIKTVMVRHPFHIEAIVVLPDHLHTIWRLPGDDADYPTRWRLIKSQFSRNIERREKVISSRLKKGERGIWQRRYWEHCIRDEKDLVTHMNYIHYNPVKHGYARKASEWPHSSIHRLIEQDVVTSDWGCEFETSTDQFGEA